MDSASGSLKHSEPCSPQPADNYRPTSPNIIKKAVITLQSGNKISLT